MNPFEAGQGRKRWKVTGTRGKEQTSNRRMEQSAMNNMYSVFQYVSCIFSTVSHCCSVVNEFGDKNGSGAVNNRPQSGQSQQEILTESS